MNRRTFVQLGALIAVAKPIVSGACAEPFVTVSYLEGLPFTVGNETRESFLKRELNAASFEVDLSERIRISVPKILEGDILPFRVEIVGDRCTEVSVFIERYAPYSGKRWAKSLETRKTHPWFGHPAVNLEMITLRCRGMTTATTDMTLVGFSSRFKQTLRTDVRLVVAATVPTKNGKNKIYVAESQLSEAVKNCGGTYFVDSYDDAISEKRFQEPVPLVYF